MEIDKIEENNLGVILNNLKDKISKAEDTCERGIDDVRTLSKYQWDYKADMDEFELATSTYSINRHATVTNEQISGLRKLKSALASPYFGKIKVAFDEDDKEDYYVGVTSIDDSNGVSVIDWRCPLASIFYNAKIGKTSYKAPLGIIDCKLEQRKQIKIRNQKIERIIESDIHIDDDVLQEVLSKSSNEKMKNIVSTIQEEQNDVIRNINDKIIIVQGCAGSGKTSIGLHRLAYLLYNDQKSKSENMLIFSPSDVFSEYISGVLPELGENNALQTTFKDFANTFVKGYHTLESYTDFISKYYNGLNTEEQNKLNKFKFSDEFMKAIDEFVKRKSDEYTFEDGITVGSTFLPGYYLNKFLNTDPYKNKSLTDKIDMLTDDLCISDFHKDFKYKRHIKSNLKLALDKINAKALYNEFLSSPEFVDRFGKKDKARDNRFLSYPDTIGLLYLYFEMTGYPKNDLIHHIVIDEAQDYNPMQIKMIKKLFNGASFTILGDANQTINPYHKYDSLKQMSKYLGNSSYIELNKAYRSTKEIMDYTNAYVANQVESVRNRGNNPVKVKDVSKKDLFKELVTDIKELKENGNERICIITRSKNECDAIYEGLKDDIENLTVLTDKTDSIHTNMLVSPAYMAKGLEFDAVISYNDKSNPYGDEDKYLYYVACTRAQHNLLVYNEPEKIKKLGGIKNAI